MEYPSAPPPPNFNASNTPSHPAPDMPQGPIAARGTMVDIRLSCRGLTSVDGLAPTSFAVVYAQTAGKTGWQEISRSETCNGTTSPDYRRIFQMEYRFELFQQLRVVVFHRNTESENLRQHTLLGVADCTLGAIVSSQGPALELPLINSEAPPGQPMGMAILSAEEIISAKKLVTLTISISGLMTEEERLNQKEHLDSLKSKAEGIVQAPTTVPKRGAAALIGRFKKLQQGVRGGADTTGNGSAKPVGALPAHMANELAKQEKQQEAIQQEIAQVEAEYKAPPPFVPFLSILRAPREASAAVDIRSKDIQWDEIYKSFEIQNYEELRDGFQLAPVTLSEYDFTEGDETRLFKLAVIRVQPGTEGMIVGEHITTFPALRRACDNQDSAVLSLEPIGKMTIRDYSETMQASFIDYLRGGWCDFGLITAIDFTSSNGDPRQADSKHFLYSPGNTPNEYEAAMRTVGNMLSSYSSDMRIPSYGFGAIVSRGTPVSHCFPVSEYELGDPFCQGVNGLINAYKATLARIQLYGPTMFSEVLRTVGVITSRRTEAAVKAGNTSLAYTVLLILTDGAISDYDASLEELIKLSFLPLSVVIIGIGDEDFGRMRTFDASNGVLRRGTDKAVREFIQFVPYNEFRGDLSHLAEKVLGGIPDQVISYIEKVRGMKAPAPSSTQFQR